MRLPRLQMWRLQMWLETLLGLWRLRRLLPTLGPLPLVLGKARVDALRAVAWASDNNHIPGHVRKGDPEPPPGTPLLSERATATGRSHRRGRELSACRAVRAARGTVREDVNRGDADHELVIPAVLVERRPNKVNGAVVQIRRIQGRPGGGSVTSHVDQETTQPTTRAIALVASGV